MSLPHASNPPVYQSGFGNHFSSEAVAGALPIGRNSPQRVAHGLYAELISGTAFTAARHENRRTWAYRRRPSVVVRGWQPLAASLWMTGLSAGHSLPPDALRWGPTPVSDALDADFIDGMRTMAVNGDPERQTGMAAHAYAFNRPMDRRAFVNADGELLIVPEQGAIVLRTELGRLEVAPGDIALIPKGLLFSVAPAIEGQRLRGYVCENYGAAFRLPELGPIGSNGLANARDFLAPVAEFDDDHEQWDIVKKVAGRFWSTRLADSPFNVVAWHGNWAPLKYDTRHFMVIGSISFDHPDPSIFTVLTSPSDIAGTANCDFVIFPPRWLVAEDTFRPPWYHRNAMSEFMGLIYGQYDAKPGGFVPGGMSLHNSMTPHGPDAEAFERASAHDLAPQKLDHTLAFMFESRMRLWPTDYAMTRAGLDRDYANCWSGLDDRFAPPLSSALTS